MALLTSSEAARRLDRTRQRVHQLVREGVLHPVAIAGGRALLFTAAEIAAVAAARAMARAAKAARREGIAR